MLLVKNKIQIKLLTLKKHIAFFLLGIFIFSITFQSIHIVWHHSHCISHNATCHNTVDCTNYTGTAFFYSNSTNHCPICEFQFSINTLPYILFFEAVIPTICRIFKVLYVTEPHQEVFALYSPRSPPI
ncbi:MAG: hypothetical protein BWY47_01510 [Bacteroidetes bacterium ADurb.Bin302]|nr:MAG: hypothetical protein BWY47_01510 [Bacteroidetes bacterium ADurb.Bin302]